MAHYDFDIGILGAGGQAHRRRRGAQKRERERFFWRRNTGSEATASTMGACRASLIKTAGVYHLMKEALALRSARGSRRAARVCRDRREDPGGDRRYSGA